MRHGLKETLGERNKFTATVGRTGKKRGYNGYSQDTLLLLEVRDAHSGDVVCDHVWFAYSKAFDKLNLKEGDKISFEARTKEYSKGYVNRAVGATRTRKDLKLSHPTKVAIITE